MQLLALPFRHHRRGERIADDVRRRAAHIEKLVDADDEQQSRFGDIEARQRGGDHNKRSAGDAGHALAGQHQQQQHGELLPKRHDDVIGLRNEQRGKGAVHHRAVEIERISHRRVMPVERRGWVIAVGSEPTGNRRSSNTCRSP